MKTKEINQYLQKYLSPFFEQHGFVLSGLDDLGYEVVKENNNIKYRGVSNRFRKRQGIAFDAFSLTIRFEAIEEVLKDILVKYELDEPSFTLRDYNDTDEIVMYGQKVIAVEINQEADFGIHAEAVMEYCNHVAFPFFDRYNTVEALNVFIKEIPEDDIAYHLGGEFQMKKMIVLKLCNDPEYDNYSEYVRQKFESIKDLDDGKYMPLLNAYYELAESLKKR
jgi:hypothetical protein